MGGSNPGWVGGLGEQRATSEGKGMKWDGIRGAGCMGRAKGRHLSTHSGNVYHAYTRWQDSRHGRPPFLKLGQQHCIHDVHNRAECVARGHISLQRRGGRRAAGRVSIV